MLPPVGASTPREKGNGSPTGRGVATPVEHAGPGTLAAFRGEWEVYPVLLLFGLWFSLMLRGSLWNDEVTYVNAATSILHGQVFVNLEHPPLAKYVIALGLLALGDGEVGARAPAMLFGLGTLYLTYRCARLLGGRAQALLSMMLLGMTSGFTTFAVQAMLDMYLAFFSMLLFYMLLRLEKEQPDLGGKAMRGWSLGFGVVSALLLLTKSYAVLFVGVAIPYVLWRLSSAVLPGQGAETNEGERDPPASTWQRSKRLLVPVPDARFVWLGFLVTLGLFCLPYLTRPHLLIYYGVGWNTAHVAVGHDVVVGGLVYRYPPVWSYLYWIYAQGFVYLVALAVVAFLMLGQLRSRTLEPAHRVYLTYTVVPLLVMSLITIKVSRYILPMFPLLAIGVFPLLPARLGRAARWFCDGAGWKVSEKAIAIGSILAVSLLVLAMPSPVVKTLNEPDIGVDSHYREAADAVAQLCEENPRATIEVASFYAKALEYYLDRAHSEVKNLHVVNLRYSSPTMLDSLKKGRVHLVVDDTVNVRYKDTELHAYVRGNARSSVDLGGGLSLFVMRSP